MSELRVWRGTREEFRELHNDKRLACDVVEFTDVAAYHSYIFIPGVKMAQEITWNILIEREYMTEQPVIIENWVYNDNRGWFMEAYNRNRLRDDYNITNEWMQDNNSFSKAGVIRGIHYQLDAQAKLVRCLTGKIIDVIVDIRADSPERCKYRTFVLSKKNAQTLYVPPGFGHAFIAIEDSQVLYKVDKPWNKELERGIRFDDPELAIPWTDWFDGECILSEKDRQLPFFKDAHKVKRD